MDLHPFDLQIQTTASDGKHTPAECVRMAKENGLTTVAITDHDTVAGVEEAIRAGAKIGLHVIPGIELSVEDHHIHLLGLGIDTTHQELQEILKEFATSRVRRAQEIVRRFVAAGFKVTWEDVMAQARDAVVTRPHIVEAILKHEENKPLLGGVSTKHDFFGKFFSEGSPYSVEHSNISARDAIHLIHSAGGIAVWSHPPVPAFPTSCRDLELFLQKLVSWGLDGIEALGPSLTESNAACLDRLWKQYDLIRTGGSDFHESLEPHQSSWPRSASRIGEFPTYGYSTDGIIEGVVGVIRDQQKKY